MRKKSVIVKFIVAGVLFTWLAKSGRLDLRFFFSGPPNILHAFGIIVLSSAILMQIFRWRLLLKTQGIFFSFKKAASISWIAEFLSLGLPGVAGGMFARGYMVLRHEDVSKLGGASTVLMDRILGLYALTCLSVASLSLLGPKSGFAEPVLRTGIVVVALFIVGSGLFALLWIERTRLLVLRVVPARFRTPVALTLQQYRRHGRRLGVCFALSLLASTLVAWTLLIAGYALGSAVSLEKIFLVAPLIFLSGTLPISPAGMGVTETAASFLLAPFGVHSGAAIFFLFRIWTVIVRLPGGVLFVLHAAGKSSRN